MKKTNDKEAAESELRRALAAARPGEGERLEDEAWAQNLRAGPLEAVTCEALKDSWPRPETDD